MICSPNECDQNQPPRSHANLAIGSFIELHIAISTRVNLAITSAPIQVRSGSCIALNWLSPPILDFLSYDWQDLSYLSSTLKIHFIDLSLQQLLNYEAPLSFSGVICSSSCIFSSRESTTLMPCTFRKCASISIFLLNHRRFCLRDFVTVHVQDLILIESQTHLKSKSRTTTSGVKVLVLSYMHQNVPVYT